MSHKLSDEPLRGQLLRWSILDEIVEIAPVDQRRYLMKKGESEDILADVASEVGWNDRSKLAKACEFIDSRDLTGEFQDWLEEKAGDENEEVNGGVEDDEVGDDE